MFQTLEPNPNIPERRRQHRDLEVDPFRLCPSPKKVTFPAVFHAHMIKRPVAVQLLQEDIDAVTTKSRYGSGRLAP